MQAKSLAIVGMRRSGTSSVSQVLDKLGVSFGPEEELFRGDEFNEEGYWEHKALAAVHRKFRMSLNLTSLEVDPLPDDWLERPATEHLLSQGQQVMEKFFAPLPTPWAWKDPDASQSLPFVYEYSRRAGVGRPHALICVRNPSDVAKSEIRRRSVPEMETISSWLAHTVAALQGALAGSRSVVMFSDFLADPVRALTPTVEALGLRPSPQTWIDATAAVRPELVRSHSNQDALNIYPDFVLRTYDLCLRASHGEEVTNEIQNCFTEWKALRGLFAQPEVDETPLTLQWERGSRSMTADQKYRPGRTWQTVSVEVDALPGTIVKVFIYPLPATVWIRKGEWRHGEETSEVAILAGKAGNLRKEFDMTCVTLLHGPDQFVVKTPNSKGPYILMLEFLVETNSLVTADTFGWLSRGRL